MAGEREQRVQVSGWRPDQYSGFVRWDWSVDCDGKDIEVHVSVGGNGGYSDRTYLPLDMLKALLAPECLDICTAAERKVLEACADITDAELSFLSRVASGPVRPIVDAELARRGGTRG